MIGRVIGAYVGSKVAQNVKGISGPTGAAIGAVAPVILRRLSWPAVVAIGVGGYLAKRSDERARTKEGG